MLPDLLTSEQLYDSIGPAYEEAFVNLTPQKDSVDWLISQLSSKKPAKILDIGCGTGRPVCRSLSNAGHEVSGIDVSSAMLNAAKKNAPKASFTKVSVLDFVAKKASYDAMTAYFSLMGDMSQDQIRNTIKRIFGWLKPGGIFIWSTMPMSGDNLEMIWFGRHCKWSSLSTEELHSCLNQVGFEILYSKESKFLPDGVKAGICKPGEAWEECQIFMYCRKPE